MLIIYGDLCHQMVFKYSMKYCLSMNTIFNSVQYLFLEITSRKYIINNKTVYNNFYYNKNKDKKFNTISDDELYSDLLYLKYLVKIY